MDFVIKIGWICDLVGWVRARLAVVFKNCCLKRCENYGLKSIVEQRVFSVNKTKKCVWYRSEERRVGKEC